ncbi:MAG: hypothetical protein LBD18_02120 [Treponema sp.]|jgi:hypothetical protein|nr:hypothetical protein [Treponema sp.]
MVFDNRILKLLTGFCKTVLQRNNIKTGLGLYSPLLVDPGDFRGFPEPLEGGLQFLPVDFFDPAVREPFLGDDFFRGVKIVEQGAEEAVDGVRRGADRLPLEAGAADGLSYRIAVFLFDEAVAVGMMGTSAGEGDAAALAPVLEMPVDKLPAAVPLLTAVPPRFPTMAIVQVRFSRSNPAYRSISSIILLLTIK